MNFEEAYHAIYVVGGWVMWPITGICFMIYANAFCVVLFVRGLRLGNSRDARYQGWVADPSTARGNLSRIIRYTQHGAEDDKDVRLRFAEVAGAILSGIDHRISFLKTLVAAAPLAGLLGTVLGMLATFDALGAGGGDTTTSISKGIQEALLTTQAGLTVALPGVFTIVVLNKHKHKVEAALARLESLTIDKIGRSAAND